MQLSSIHPCKIRFPSIIYYIISKIMSKNHSPWAHCITLTHFTPLITRQRSGQSQNKPERSSPYLLLYYSNLKVCLGLVQLLLSRCRGSVFTACGRTCWSLSRSRDRSTASRLRNRGSFGVPLSFSHVFS